MEIIQKNIRANYGDEVHLYFLGDMHEGNCNHAEKELKQAVDIIRNDDNGYWVGMGDYIEAITSSDPRFNPLELSRRYSLKDLKDLPRKQVEAVYQTLDPIREKCLALVCGNHEEAYIKYNSFDVYDYFASMFPDDDLKIGYVGFLKLGIIHQENRERPNQTYVIALNHGTGGGGYREGYPINKVHDLFRWTDADINIMGHLHLLYEDSKDFIGVTQSNKIIFNNRHWGVSGCFLKTYVLGNTNYFEHKGKPTSDIGMLKATIKVGSEKNCKLEKVFL